MKNEGKFFLGILFGTAIGAAATVLLNEEKRSRIVDNINSTAYKMKDGVMEGYYEAKNKYRKFRNDADEFIDDVEEKIEEEVKDVKKEIKG